MAQAVYFEMTTFVDCDSVLKNLADKLQVPTAMVPDGLRQSDYFAELALELNNLKNEALQRMLLARISAEAGASSKVTLSVFLQHGGVVRFFTTAVVVSTGAFPFRIIVRSARKAYNGLAWHDWVRVNFLDWGEGVHFACRVLAIFTLSLGGKKRKAGAGGQGAGGSEVEGSDELSDRVFLFVERFVSAIPGGVTDLRSRHPRARLPIVMRVDYMPRVYSVIESKDIAGGLWVNRDPDNDKLTWILMK